MASGSDRNGLAYSGYHVAQDGAPDLALTQVGRGTPGGEYLRRFWQPIAYESEIKDLPVRARIMGEDLVIFRDRGGRIGVLHLHCSHRGTSLEFGLIAERGIRCCYHGRLYDVDGTILDMPGEPASERLKQEMRQGAYPVHLYGGMIFAYMGPPDRIPPFPVYDRYELPGVTLQPGPRMVFECNWIQVKENALDPAHTAVLHTIKGADQFSDEFGQFPELAFGETPAGLVYVAVRPVGDNLWIRSTDVMAPNIHSITSITEDGRKLKRCAPPWLTIWTTPIDDNCSINFLLRHLDENDRMPMERRRAIEKFGQTPERSYEERQRIPGDYDAMVSQGPTAIHAQENLGTLDQGVVMFRRYIREGMDAVQRGQDPRGLFRGAGRIPTYGTDRVIRASEMGGDAGNSDARREFAHRMTQEYVKAPPLRDYVRTRVPA